MDFQSFKRRDLQSLCKLNKLPANTTNAAMAESLASLTTVEGLEEFLGNLDSELQGSPERSVIPKSNAPRTNTRQKAAKEELGCSNLGTRTRCRTRTKAVEETNTRKTPATRTTRNRASQEASIQQMDKDMQAEFEAGMDQSQISENNVLPEVEHQDISEEVSGVSVENEGHLLSESQSEAQNTVYDGQEVVDVDDSEKNKEEDHILNDIQPEDSEMSNNSDSKMDYHSLSRKDLQSLCKKNKIPANMTNAAMADALEALQVVEGLQEFVKGCDSQALSSPVAGINSSCARRSRTTQKITKEEPRSSKLITKSCRGSRRRIIEEETIQGKDDLPKTPAAPTTRQEDAQTGSALYETQEKEDSAAHKSELKRMEKCMETSEVSGVAEFNSDICNSNNDLLGVENSKEQEELVSEVGENAIEEEVLESAEFSKVLTDSVKVDIGSEVITSCVDDYELENSEFHQSNNLEIDADSEPEDGQLDNLDNVNANDQMSKELISECSTQADQLLSLERNDESKSGNDNLEKAVTTSQADKPSPEHIVQSESEGGYSEDELSEKSDSEANSQDDHLSMEVNVESESEETDTEDDGMSEKCGFKATFQEAHKSMEVNVESESEETEIEDDGMSEKFDFKATSQDVHGMEVNVVSESEEGVTENEMSEKSDDQVSLEINVESKFEAITEVGNAEDSCWVEKPEDGNAEDKISNNFNLEATTQPTDSCWVEKPEVGNAEDMISNKFDLEATTQANSCRLTEKDLYEKSLRKLKMLYKEKLQEAKLAKKMENLTLKETEIPLAKVEEDLQECLVKPEGVVSPSVELPGDDEHSVVVPQTIPEDGAIDDHAEKSEESTNAETTNNLYPVDILLHNEVTSEAAVTGNINVATYAPQSTPSKCSSKTNNKSLLPTPSKSSSKTQVSAGRKGVLIDNKENINISVSKTEPGKIKIAATENVDILSPLSMAKLKRDIKLLKQSETKKQALQSRPENLLASP